MNSVLDRLEQIKSKLMYAVTVGHSFIAVSRIMVIVNRISKILGHYRPLNYDHPYSQDTPQRKVYDSLDAAHQELFDLLMSHTHKTQEQIGEDNYNDLRSMLTDLTISKDRAFDKEHGPGASLLKRGRRFNPSSLLF